MRLLKKNCLRKDPFTQTIKMDKQNESSHSEVRMNSRFTSLESRIFEGSSSSDIDFSVSIPSQSSPLMETGTDKAITLVFHREETSLGFRKHILKIHRYLHSNVPQLGSRSIGCSLIDASSRSMWMSRKDQL